MVGAALYLAQSLGRFWRSRIATLRAGAHPNELALQLSHRVSRAVALGGAIQGKTKTGRIQGAAATSTGRLGAFWAAVYVTPSFVTGTMLTSRLCAILLALARA